jgi:hypothetical protein
MILLLPCLGLSSLTFLNEKTIDILVNTRLPHQVAAVLFDDVQRNSRDFRPWFRNASDALEGMAKFGVIDVRRYLDLSRSYNVSRIPAVHFFSDSGMSVYEGSNTTKALVKAVTALIPDATLPVTSAWANESGAFAIFFTATGRFPAVWKSIAIHYNGTNVRIGVTNSTEFANSFAIASVPAIYATNGRTSGYYKGKLTFSAVRDWLDALFIDPRGRAKPERQLHEIESPDQFSAICVNGPHLCVVVRASSVTSEIDAIKKGFKKLKLNWFVGIEGLPYDFMKNGTGSWVYNPKRDAFAHAPTVDELKSILESVENGQAKWTKAPDLTDL